MIAKPSDGNTWTTTAGLDHRMDFVGVPRDGRKQATEALVERNIDLSLGRVDRSVPMVVMTVLFEGADAPQPDPSRSSTGGLCATLPWSS